MVKLANRNVIVTAGPVSVDTEFAYIIGPSKLIPTTAIQVLIQVSRWFLPMDWRTVLRWLVPIKIVGHAPHDPAPDGHGHTVLLAHVDAVAAIAPYQHH